MFNLREARLVVVGLGLMGGSLAAALKARRICREVWGVTRRPETLEAARKRGLIDLGSTDPAPAMETANLVVLATPVRVILDLIPRLGRLLPPGGLRKDRGCTKRAVTTALATLPAYVQCLGGHPICGREQGGLDAADANLFQGAVFALTPMPRTSVAALAQAEEFVRLLGSRPLVLDAAQHDRWVAATSHLPYLLACALVASTEVVAETDTGVWGLAASGFRDTSRLAACDETMMLDILLTNRGAVGQMLTHFRDQVDNAARLLETEDEAGLRAAMTAAAQRRRSLFR